MSRLMHPYHSSFLVQIVWDRVRAENILYVTIFVKVIHINNREIFYITHFKASLVRLLDTSFLLGKIVKNCFASPEKLTLAGKRLRRGKKYKPISWEWGKQSFYCRQTIMPFVIGNLATSRFERQLIWRTDVQTN